MASTQQLKRRIGSVKNTKQILVYDMSANNLVEKEVK